MKAIVYEKYSSPSVLQSNEIEKSFPNCSQTEQVNSLNLSQIQISIPLKKKNSYIHLIPILCAIITGICILLLGSTNLVSIPLALFDSFDFYTFALFFTILQKKKPIQNFLSFLIPYFLGYWAIGIFYVYLGDKIEILMGYLKSPTALLIYQIIAGVVIIVGVIMLTKSIKNKNKDNSNEISDENNNKFRKLKVKISKKYHNYSGFKYVLLAVSSLIFYLPFAYPYLGLIAGLRRFQYSNVSLIFMLLMYSTIFVLPYILLLYFYLRYKEQFDAKFSGIFGKISTFFDNSMLKSSLCLLFGSIVLIFINFFV